MLVLLDGSPRGPRSNTHLLLEAFAAGYRRAGGGPVSSHYVSKRKRWPELFAALAQADIVILAMPLYVHAMPATVKELIEALPTFDPLDPPSSASSCSRAFPSPRSRPG